MVSHSFLLLIILFLPFQICPGWGANPGSLSLFSLTLPLSCTDGGLLNGRQWHSVSLTPLFAWLDLRLIWRNSHFVSFLNLLLINIQITHLLKGKLNKKITFWWISYVALRPTQLAGGSSVYILSFMLVFKVAVSQGSRLKVKAPLF